MLLWLNVQHYSQSDNVLKNSFCYYTHTILLHNFITQIQHFYYIEMIFD